MALKGRNLSDALGTSSQREDRNLLRFLRQQEVEIRETQGKNYRLRKRKPTGDSMGPSTLVNYNNYKKGQAQAAALAAQLQQRLLFNEELERARAVLAMESSRREAQEERNQVEAFALPSERTGEGRGTV